eukprot:gene25448-31082_t
MMCLSTRRHWSLDRSSAEASEEPQGFVWEADHTGVAQALELDDWEATLLCTWIKTGHWLHPEAQSLLDITLAPPVDATTADVQDVLQLQLTGGKGVRLPEVDRGLGLMLPENDSGLGPPVCDDGLGLMLTENDSGVGLMLPENDSGVGLMLPENDSGLGPPVRAELTLSADKRWPVSVRLLVYGDEETWDLQSWQPLLNDRLFPSSIINCPAAGTDEMEFAGRALEVFAGVVMGKGSGRFAIEGGSAVKQPVLFNLPTSATSGGVAPGVTFEEPRSKVPMQWVRSGHILVWPLVNSRQIGPFILDTGASGMVMTPAAAEELDLP